MKFKILFILFISFLLLIATTSYAKDKTTWLKKLKTGIKITKGVTGIAKDTVDIANSLKQLAKRETTTTKNFVYKNKTIKEESNNNIDNEKIRLKKDLGKTKRILAWEKAKDKKHNEAILLYEEALEYDANNPKIWHGYGWSLSELGRYDEAYHAFMMAINQGGTSKSWRYLGWNFERQNKINDAIFCYQEAIKKDPKNSRAKYALNKIREANKKNNIKSEIVKSDNDDLYSIIYNNNGAVLKSSIGKKIYIGKDCDSSSKKYGKGIWGWDEEKFIISFKNKKIKFKKQKTNLSVFSKCKI